jgi:hypothetical protein
VQTTGLLVSLVDELGAEGMRERLTTAVSHKPCLGLCGSRVWYCVCHSADGKGGVSVEGGAEIGEVVVL